MKIKYFSLIFNLEDWNGHDDNDVSDNHHLSDNESNHVELTDEQFNEGLTSVANVNRTF